LIETEHLQDLFATTASLVFGRTKNSHKIVQLLAAGAKKYFFFFFFTVLVSHPNLFGLIIFNFHRKLGDFVKDKREYYQEMFTTQFKSEFKEIEDAAIDGYFEEDVSEDILRLKVCFRAHCAPRPSFMKQINNHFFFQIQPRTKRIPELRKLCIELAEEISDALAAFTKKKFTELGTRFADTCCGELARVIRKLNTFASRGDLYELMKYANMNLFKRDLIVCSKLALCAQEKFQISAELYPPMIL
jgi:hypothetical protein